MARVETKQYSTVAIPTGLWMQIRKLVQATGSYTSEAEFVREAVREKLRALSIVELKDMPEERVREAVLNYIRQKGRAYPSDITGELGIPYFSVAEAVEKLVQEGLLVPAEETP